MKILKSPRSMQKWARAQRQAGCAIAFVPTMGCLHAGHYSLVQAARKRVGSDGKVVVSIFVNPTQFGPGEDLDAYPRTLRTDLWGCREHGVDAAFVPNAAAMYPTDKAREYSTFVVEEQLSRPLEGASRPTHFRGVTTIVAKLFHCVLPDVAVFGAKDWQQARVIQRMVADLNFPIRIIVAPTHREPDGLAMSSRNRYLNDEERSQATVLWRFIQAARKHLRNRSRPVDAEELQELLFSMLRECPSAKLDYVAFFDSKSFQPMSRIRRGTHVALAVRLGTTRLIDNAIL